jgi:sec-independent protein translocase protein TatB
MDLGIGTAELIVIAAVALIVVGPKDLPLLMRKIGGFMSKMRSLASEFRASFDEMARQAELDELRKEVEALRQGRMDAARADVEGTFRAIDQDLAMPGMGQMASTTGHADEAAEEAFEDLDFDEAETPPAEIEPERER